MSLPLTVYSDRVLAAQRAVDQETGEARALAREGMRVQQLVAELEEAVALHERVCAVLTSYGEQQQTQVQQQIEQLVTQGLQVVFEENLSFHLIQSVKANQAVVEFVVRSAYGDKTVDTPVMDARGGGLAAVVGFILRLVVLLKTPSVRKLLILDESFAHVSAEYRSRLAEFLRAVADRAGVQVFMITHDPDYGDVADKLYRLELNAGGETEVTAL
jgi:DNA repair exonuclease SbcCD ATPase subunit